MFGGAGAESLCCKTGAGVGYALETGAGASLAPSRSRTARTIMARDMPFPMTDPYSPVNRARVPVPGYNVWPQPANRLGKRYYGLSGLPGADRRPTGKRKKTFAGLGTIFSYGSGNVDWLGTIEPPPVYGPPASQPGSFNWDNFFGGLFKTLPGTISAVTGRGDPLLRTTQQFQAQQGSQYGYPPEGYYYNSSGQLVKDAANNVTDFITENPLLVGGAIVGAVLLFMRPPGRR